MAKQGITTEIMEYMIWVVELISNEFFNGDKTYTYRVLNEQGIWSTYVQSYDITHTLSANNIIGEVRDVLTAKEVI